MTRSHTISAKVRCSFSTRLGALLGAFLTIGLLTIGLLTTPSASADYEQVGIFAGILKPPAEPGVFPEEVQLGGVSGMAVNYTGAGGVTPGTVYAATYPGLGGEQHIVVFKPNSEGTLTFSQAWAVSPLEGEYERCGPEGDPAFPHCKTQIGNGNPAALDVDIDQTTGNVYVLAGEVSTAGGTMVTVYSPEGSKEIARFGERAVSGEATAASPEKIHYSSYPGGIAVNGAGEVFVFDSNPYSDGFYRRLMRFKPQIPNDFEHYVYAGQNEDVSAGFPLQTQTVLPGAPVTDAAGDIYVAGEDYIAKLDPEQPPSSPPVCKFEFPKGGITAITVNPFTGEAFFFSVKSPKRIHRLSPCNEEGEFTELESIKAAPERNDLYGLAYDPVRQLSPSRAPGVLYGGAPSGEPPVGKGEPGQSSLGYIFAQVEENPPVVKSESATQVTTTTATLGAQINPRGSETSYAFQYLTKDAYEEAGESFSGAAEAPLGGAVLGSGQEALSAAVAVSGLAPDTEYRYRVIATSHCSVGDKEKVCEGTGPPQAFRTYPVEAPGMHDHRAYELVSPVDKQGGQVFPAIEGGTCGRAECKPHGSFAHPMQSTPSGDAIAYPGTPFSPSEGAIAENEYVSRRTAAGWQTVNLTPSLLQVGPGYQAVSTELTKAVLKQAGPQLSPEAPGEYPNLYVQPTLAPASLTPLLMEGPPNRPGGSGPGHLELAYAGVSGDLSHVFFTANDALTGETPFAPEAADGGPGKQSLYEWSEGQLRLVNVLPGNAATDPGAFFGSTKVQNASSSTHAISEDGSKVFWSDEAGQAYVREDAQSTTAIPDPGEFLSASLDGSRALLDNGHLYDLESEATTDLTEGKGGFLGIVGQSDGLSHVYFVDTAVLDETPNGEGEVAQAGKDNLYSWDEGDTAFVATLLPADGPGGNSGLADWASLPSLRSAEASPSGGWVAFLSTARLTGYDNTGPCTRNGEGKVLIVPCPEAFLYDSATGKLACASCNPSEERPLGFTQLGLIGGGFYLPQPRYLTDEGRLFFNSGDSLTPFDTNEGAEDVYEYEPSGVGTCKREAGCISLVSNGHEASDSNFLAMSEGGRDVFFTTRDQLVLKDHDEFFDVYDAREDGGIPSETETARVECQGEACVAALSPPNDPTPGSSTFEGAGNVDEKKAAKKHKKKRKHAKKKSHKRSRANHNRGGAK